MSNTVNMSNISRTFNVSSGPHAGMAVSIVGLGLQYGQVRLHPQGTRPTLANSVVPHSGRDANGRPVLQYKSAGPRSKLYRALAELGLPAAEILREAQRRRKRQQFSHGGKYAGLTIWPNYKHYAQHPRAVASYTVVGKGRWGKLVPHKGGYKMYELYTGTSRFGGAADRSRLLGYHAGSSLKAAAKHLVAIARFNKVA